MALLHGVWLLLLQRLINQKLLLLQLSLELIILALSTYRAGK